MSLSIYNIVGARSEKQQIPDNAYYIGRPRRNPKADEVEQYGMGNPFYEASMKIKPARIKSLGVQIDIRGVAAAKLKDRPLTENQTAVLCFWVFVYDRAQVKTVAKEILKAVPEDASLKCFCTPGKDGHMCHGQMLYREAARLRGEKTDPIGGGKLADVTPDKIMGEAAANKVRALIEDMRKPKR
jgi:hypothetical protein